MKLSKADKTQKMEKPQVDKSVETDIANRFWKAVIKRIEEDSGDRSGIHVTDLVYDCLRRAYYDKKLGELVSAVSDSEGLMVLWIGQMLHEMPFGEGCEHEKPIEITFEGSVKVEGRVDELCQLSNGSHIVIDKKTTRNIPNAPYDHHVKQVLFYSAILTKVYGYKVSSAGVFYLDVANLKTKLYIIPVTPLMIEAALKEMERKARLLKQALDTGIPPTPEPGWLCSYCPYFKKCVMDGWGQGLAPITKGSENQGGGGESG
jgi:CRISPR/Cas system-associated exonuclease Cas4 (RecB family)